MLGVEIGKGVRSMKEHLLLSIVAILLLVMGAASREIIADYGIVKFVIVGTADALLLTGLTYKTEAE